MRRIKKEDIENTSFYQVPKSLFEMMLNGDITTGAFCLYVLMYEKTRLSAKNNWIDKEDDVYIMYSWESMKEDRKVKSRTQIKRDLDKLYELGLLETKKNFQQVNKYYLNIFDEENSTQSVNSIRVHKICQQEYTNCEHKSTQIVTTSNNNNNNNIKITTTKKVSTDLVIDRPVQTKNTSSSSIDKNIKEYLLKTIKDIQTCKNICKILEKNNIKLDKLKDIINYAQKNSKGNGYIVKALQENWEIPKEQSKTNTTTSNYSKSMISKAEEVEKRNKEMRDEYEKEQEFNTKINLFFDQLAENIKAKIINKAKEQAIQLYGFLGGKDIFINLERNKIIKKEYANEICLIA